jgi:Holliday junction resolvase-like predicted endonuclease
MWEMWSLSHSRDPAESDGRQDSVTSLKHSRILQTARAFTHRNKRE